MKASELPSRCPLLHERRVGALKRCRLHGGASGRVKHREFITLIGGAAAGPGAARAQQSKPPTIGVLGTSTSVAMNRRVAAFGQRVGGTGVIGGRNGAIGH